MDSFGRLLPRLVTAVPGPASRALGRRLRAVESRNVTFLSEAFPVFWESARGANVRDADGNVFLDLTSAFGVSLLGHSPTDVVAAFDRQARELLHGMGDVHPPIAKVRLLEALAEIVPFDDARSVLATSGSEAVEIALKTARLASGRPGILALEGGYHGLTVGALSVTSRAAFRRPVLERLFDGVTHLPFPRGDAGGRARAEAIAALDRALDDPPTSGPIGTVVLEPVQARAGVRPVPRWWADALMERVERHGLILVADEIYTGLGRCGAVLASHLVGLRPHIVCLGKVLGGGVPISACVAPSPIMDAWPESDGEALHTSTFLGHPASCAAAEAALARVRAGLPDEARALGEQLLTGLRRNLRALVDEGLVEVRGLGLLVGIEIRDPGRGPRAAAGVEAAQELLTRGVITLPAGASGAVVELSPPVGLSPDQVEHAVRAVAEVVAAVARRPP